MLPLVRVLHMTLCNFLYRASTTIFRVIEYDEHIVRDHVRLLSFIPRLPSY
jgi:hypothetical protein